MTTAQYLHLPVQYRQYMAFDGMTTMKTVLEDTGEIVTLAVSPIGELHRILG